jgi:osmoprotectant transport system ATP-binding protein
LQRQFVDLTRRLGKTAVFVTHDLREALRVGSRIGLMHAGRLVLLDTPEEFLKSKEKHAQAYLETLKLQVEAESAGGSS